MKYIPQAMKLSSKQKGDHNESPDGYLIETSEVIGTVKFKIRYIGYPTVALNEKINS